ncbi:sensor histidine kinase [Oscillatoria acuminata]|uniref:histidine kinase n=1 Tax=Oscillatoria acuminata PCC 6304 TaxID=56110 RepID=K9TL52_9CYAN|nr:HAMP domain-containing sensor histidine kinase [Oscillatoria acuminata]AFY83255.1 signal transduction histidine kinase [Oscillatoria acuminata PCC 6304]
MYKWVLPTISEVLAQAGKADNSSDPGMGLTGEDPGDRNGPTPRPDAATVWLRRIRADRQWQGAVASVCSLLDGELAGDHPDTHNPLSTKGLVLSGPVPVLTQSPHLEQFSTWTFAGVQQSGAGLSSSLFFPTTDSGSDAPNPTVLPLLTGDPLAREQFCLVLTARFSLVMLVGLNPQGQPAFQFSFDPETIALVWQGLRSRLLPFKNQTAISTLDQQFQRFHPCTPDYKIVCQFTQQLLEYLPDPLELDREMLNEMETFAADWTGWGSSMRALPQSGEDCPNGEAEICWEVSRPDGNSRVSTSGERRTALNNPDPGTAKTLRSKGGKAVGTVSAKTANPRKPAIDQPLDDLRDAASKNVRNQAPALDVELLQAIAHEVRTPLATIRTLTRLLLKRRHLDAEIIKRLEAIDRECSEQIDRFGLFFRAVELETTKDAHAPVHLTSTSLTQVLNSCIPRWEKQASRRNLTLDVILPQKMPSVVSDPSLLDQVLTGAIDNFTSTLPAGGKLRVEISLAGHQLKVELHSQTHASVNSEPSVSGTQALKSLGQMLMFQPETGNLSLNLSVTKNLFQALGGKLIVRNRHQHGQVLTIFLPLEMRG